ncbi:MAG TPA: chemotaxis protein CheW [Acetomicrobium flavidum]|uniref:Chemotaxis signal transduction protein n=1 Tax=Acetomicrobium mobile (strain ATCC BAA-54 / DSM 13181 / JCM 12221 / NGA) TaxID=891968 RepID=I4BYF5_ACEMN|nr:chemotaxis protein CheW [Acetomicrobium mobile]HOJ82734.1 chemotaxis protein CheW [Acetomicrobium flavidum]AFM22312.1 chemotaxis signal transduction protein [Acetomicrobium mobile DSM 13181]HOM31843.1 chemotaxis protein CheW [Acetomicrobium flavidum]HOP87684.1 chemotaxis protein CheW [Acetomicrobium flavidum]HPP13810.1 chemotaxis protein CheW [Acetomicrobium flavidum]
MAVKESTSTVEDTSQETKNGKEKTLLVFDLFEEHYAIEVSKIKEIVRIPESITRVPNAPAYVCGVINLRGTVIPVMDIAVKMNRGKIERRGESRIVVIEEEDIVFGILVDSVREVRTVNVDQIESAESIDSVISKEYLQGIVRTKDGDLIVLLDVASIFDIRSYLE